MKTKLLVLFTRTPLHVGAGNSVGVVDAPIMRERHTQTPIIPGSSLKGVLADLWNDGESAFDEKGKRSGELKALFGSDDDKSASSGSLLVGEARALAFPLRSAKGGFAWITCPHALKKFARDAGKTFPSVPEPENEKCFSGRDVVFSDKDAVVLEEYKFSRIGGVPAEIADELKALLPGDPVWRDVGERLVIVSDELFSYFVANACEAVTRICVDDKKGTVADGALFNLEQAPSETLFYAVVGAAKKTPDADLDKLKKKLEACGNVLQVGGDATVGLGFCSVNLL